MCLYQEEWKLLLINCGAVIWLWASSKADWKYPLDKLKRMIGKPDESLGRKATGPLKWQPVAWNEVHCLSDSVFLWCYFIDVTIMILSGKNEENKSMKKVKHCLIAVVSGVLVATAVLSGCGQSKKKVSKNDDHLTVYLWENRLMKNIAPYIHWSAILTL